MKEALKLALEALKMADELCGGHGVDFKEYGLEFDRDIQVKYKDAITAIKEALAQPEQEPLEYWNTVEGWVKIDEVREHFDSVGCGTIYKTTGEGRVPVYTAPELNQFKPDWDTQAVLVEEMQRMAKRIEDLEAMLERQTARIVDLQTHIENFEGED